MTRKKNVEEGMWKKKFVVVKGVNYALFTPSLLLVESIVNVKKSLLPGLFRTIKDVANLPFKRY